MGDTSPPPPASNMGRFSPWARRLGSAAALERACAFCRLTSSLPGPNSRDLSRRLARTALEPRPRRAIASASIDAQNEVGVGVAATQIAAGESLAQQRVDAFEQQPPYPARQSIVERRQSAESPALSGRSQDFSPCPTAPASRLVSIQLGDALRHRQQMTILGGGGLDAIPQSACPDALAASGCIIKQPEPLRAAIEPRADKHRPEAAVSERPHSDTDHVFDAVLAEPDKRGHRVTPDVAVRDQGRHANQRQIINSDLHVKGIPYF
jgi:hypothetical protein